MQNQIKVNKTYLLVALSISFMLAGLYRGEVGVVLKKAIRICLECIGVG